MKSVSHLPAGSIKADVTQAPPPKMGVDPIGKNALIGAAELAGARQHAAPGDPDGEAKRFSVLESHALGGEFGAAVQRDGGLGGEIHADALGGQAWGKRTRWVQLDGVSGNPERQRCQRRDGVLTQKFDIGKIASERFERQQWRVADLREHSLSSTGQGFRLVRPRPFRGTGGWWCHSMGWPCD